MASERKLPFLGALRPSFPCTGADLRAARDCELVVLGRRFANSSAELEAEYGPYESSTSFGAVFVPDGTAVAAIRLIRNGRQGLKSLNDAAAAPWLLPVHVTCQAADIDPTSTWDVGSFGVQVLDLPGALPTSYLGSSASVAVYRHVRDLHRLHFSRFADVHQQVFHGRVIGMDPRGCQPGAFELEAA